MFLAGKYQMEQGICGQGMHSAIHQNPIATTPNLSGSLHHLHYLPGPKDRVTI